MRNGREMSSSSSSSSSSPPPMDFDVGLGLKMQSQSQSSESFHCDGGGSGVGLFLSNPSNQIQNFGDIFEPTSSLSLPRSFQRPAYTSGAGLAASGKSLFTVSQLQEFERQNVIHKYIMSSIAVPPELHLPAPRFPLLAQLSQSNIGSDPEPWRCKRTDGKKWRCSRDVTPDQKYCERHAHKSRPRSRKHVEVSPKTAVPNNPSSTHEQLQKPASQLASMSLATSYDQTRCIEWLLRGSSSNSNGSSSAIPVSTCNQQQWQQVLQASSSSSSRLELRDSTSHNKNVPPAYQPHQYEDNRSLMSLNMHIPDNVTSLHTSERPEAKHFINAWEKESLTTALSKKLSPSSSLTLSMSAANSHDEDNYKNGHLGVGMISLDRQQHVDGIMKPGWWLNPAPWMNSPPGGPLGEALCLGSGTSATRVGSNLASPRGYSNSSSCSKSSGEEGSHGLYFIG